MDFAKRTFIISCSLSMLLAGTSACLAANNTVKTIKYDSECYYYNYNETDSSGVWQDSEKGWINGIGITYQDRNLDTDSYWQIRLNRTSDDLNYNGSYLETGLPLQTTTSHTFLNLEYTYALPLFEKTHLIAGLGYHSWDRRLSSGQDEFYHWFYIPVGLCLNFSSGANIECALDVTANLMFNGQMKSEMTGYQDFTVNLGNKPGFKIALPVTYHILSQFLSIGMTPWFEYSGIGMSNTVPLMKADGSYSGDAVYEPDSTTKQYGIDFMIQCHF